MRNRITPESRICYPVSVKYTQGKIITPEGILEGDGHAVLKYEKGGVKPFLCIDLGPASPGGYPIFEIDGFEGEARLRLAYADWYDYICDPEFREYGDFKRGSCKYLGPELPVLPADPYRFELYNICRTGTYIYPLIQGQQRFVLLTLDTPDTAVSISSFHIYYTSSLESYSGGFSSSSAELDYLWDASVYTVQLATISNSQTIEHVEGRMVVRTLTKGNDAAIIKVGSDWSDCTLHLSCEAVIHPHSSNCIRWMVRAVDSDNGYVISLREDGTVIFYLRSNGVDRELSRKKLDSALVHNRIYNVDTILRGNEIRVCADTLGEAVFFDSTYPKGTFGFCQTAESWSIIHKIEVTDAIGDLLFCDRMTGDLSDYEFTHADEFIADGAKRDRLPWVGDLYWAFENVFYSFGKFKPADNTVEMFRRHQCPDGFVWGTCYPENTVNPALHDYGMYQSDIFSAWYIITVAYHYLFTADRTALKKWYSSVKSDAEYLIGNIDANGLFYQRYETSKGLWDHFLNDHGYNSYNNLIVIQALRNTAHLAEAMKDGNGHKRYTDLANNLLDRTIEVFFDTDGGFFTGTDTNRSLCYISNAFALAFGLVPKKYIKKNIEVMCEAQNAEFQMGKTVILFIKGCFKNGFSDIAYNILTGSTGKLDYLGECTLNWIDAVRDEKGPACTAECMPYGHERIATGESWNDYSHPDTAIAFLMSAYIAGIRPISAGFKKFRFAPSPCSLSHVEVTVPTPHGNIEASFSVQNGVLSAHLRHPQGTAPEISLPEAFAANAKLTIEEYQQKR